MFGLDAAVHNVDVLRVLKGDLGACQLVCVSEVFTGRG